MPRSLYPSRLSSKPAAVQSAVGKTLETAFKGKEKKLHAAALRDYISGKIHEWYKSDLVELSKLASEIQGVVGNLCAGRLGKVHARQHRPGP